MILQPHQKQRLSQHACRATWEVPPTGRRRLLQDLRSDLNTIPHLSGRRRSLSCAPWQLFAVSLARRLPPVPRRAEDTANSCCELERSLALYQRRLQQVLGLTRVEALTECRRHRPKVVGLLPVAGQTSGARRLVIRARTRVWKSCPASDDAWPSLGR